MKGIDVSVYNGKVDWSKVKSAGIEFAMIRAGYGKEVTQKDIQFDNNIKEAKAAGVKVGAYWFSYALNVEDAKLEAKTCLQIIGTNKLDFPIAFDFEYDSVAYASKNGITVTKDLATDIALAFLTEIKNNGQTAVYYANPDYINNYFNTEKLKEFDLWLAAWSKTTPTYNQTIWQYSSDGAVDGIIGKVDLNIGYKDYSTAANPSVPTNPTPPASPTPPVETTPVSAPKETVYTVVRGDTLSSIAQKYGTTVKSLADYNGIKNVDFILIGQKIKIPNKTGAQTGGAASSAATNTAPSQTSSPPTSNTISSCTGIVKAGKRPNVRATPSLLGKTLGTLSPLQTVTVLGQTGSWYQIKYGNGTAYTATMYMDVKGTVPK